jgi:hypothetical protein
MWGISRSLVTKSDLKEVVDSNSRELERPAYRLSICFLMSSSTMQREAEIQSLPGPSLQSLLTKAPATPNKVSASRRPPIEGVIGGSLPRKQTPKQTAW